MNAYYNEHDRFAAAWLRELISDGLIPAGDVDERDIQLVQPADLAGYVSCHFFAGIGGWAYALRLAGWPDDRPVWTGSCPCQPFSAAGKQGGFEDSRHLWPSWFRLIRECRPPVVFGEQVASADGLAWFDTVSTDLEAEAYAVGAADLAAASVGAPHIRQRLFFVAKSGGDGCARPEPKRDGHAHGGVGSYGVALGDTVGPRLEGLRDSRPGAARREAEGGHGRAAGGSVGVGLADTDSKQRGAARRHSDTGADGRDDARGRSAHRHSGVVGDPELHGCASAEIGGSTQAGEGESGLLQSQGSNPWADLIWLPCRDGKARPTQPGLFPLAHGVSNRVGTLRGAGNAICPQVAAQFILAAEGEA